MDREQKQQAIRELILKYTLPDALKPEYDGMTAWELAGMILEITGNDDKQDELWGSDRDNKNEDNNLEREQ